MRTEQCLLLSLVTYEIWIRIRVTSHWARLAYVDVQAFQDKNQFYKAKAQTTTCVN